ncbi:unnamed protein product [Schistosoma rodhaini]|nr:unnamed protein product [Schistosoma rodhaini]
MIPQDVTEVRPDYTEMKSRNSSPSHPVTESCRIIQVNKPQLVNYCKNNISTAKYNFLTFIPKFVTEQFRRYANIFFLVIALLQQIPGVSPTGRFTTLVPLCIILTVSAIKEVIEDFRRHRADDATNNEETLVLRNHVWVKICWKDLEVGDLVKVLSNEGIPADLVLLASSEPQAMCYIETSNLDGETNLKLRQGLPVTTHLLTAGELSSFDAVVECEPPNRKLDEFVGVIRTADGIAHPLNPTQLILRGASLKNTKWIFGLTVYTGKESKVMLNSTAAPLKRSTVERQTNNYILCLFGVLLFLTLFTFIANLVWTSWNEKKMWYLQENVDTRSDLRRLLDFITCLILYNTIIPISLPVMLEVVRFIQALYINWDLDMYDSDSDTPAMARTSNLNEELGQVRYIFSDKTGTLTRNVMEFKRCSIGGIMYGNGTEDSNALEDQNLINKLNAGDLLVDQFFTILAVCHTVVPERSVNENNTNNNNDNINNNVAVFCNDNLNNEQLINYQASSPDEAALVKAARTMGYVFTTRTPTEVVVKIRGVEKHYGILHVLDFTSFRKRMGVVVREPNGRISVMVKGAIFTAAPPMALGLFDRSCSVNNCLKYPELYKDTQASASFNPKVFFCWIFNSIYHSSLLFWIPLLAFSVGTVYANGQTSSLLVLGNSVYTYVVVTVCLKAGLEHTAWTWLSHLAIWGSIGCWFLFLTIYPHVYPTLPLASDMVGMDSAVYGCGIFWFGFLLIPMIALTRDIAWKMAKRVTAGSLREQVMQMEQMQVDPGRLIRASIRPKSTDRSAFVRIMRRSMGSQALLNLCLGASVRTNTTSPTPITDSRQTDHGYAFSQEEHGAVSQSQLIRAYDSTRRKPDGR